MLVVLCFSSVFGSVQLFSSALSIRTANQNTVAEALAAETLWNNWSDIDLCECCVVFRTELYKNKDNNKHSNPNQANKKIQLYILFIYCGVQFNHNAYLLLLGDGWLHSEKESFVIERFSINKLLLLLGSAYFLAF